MQKPERITVMIIDSQPLYRSGLADAIRRRAELRLVGEAADLREALPLLRVREPDVVVLDVSRALRSVAATLAEIKHELPSVRVLSLSNADDVAIVEHTIHAGADGYMTKTADEREVCDGIVSVTGGNRVLSRELTAAIAARREDESAHQRPQLSGREHQVLAFVAEGLSVREIASKLYLSESTVKTHRDRIFRKLGKHERAAAVAQAFRMNMLI